MVANAIAKKTSLVVCKQGNVIAWMWGGGGGGLWGVGGGGMGGGGGWYGRVAWGGEGSAYMIEIGLYTNCEVWCTNLMSRD